MAANAMIVLNMLNAIPADMGKSSTLSLQVMSPATGMVANCFPVCEFIGFVLVKWVISRLILAKPNNCLLSLLIDRVLVFVLSKSNFSKSSD